MSKLRLTIATTDYDHFRDFRLGTVQAEGIDTVWSMLGHHEIFARMTFNREWDASELSFAKFCAQVTRKDSDLIGLPVVCSRLFRFSSFYVNKKSKIRTAKDLKGKKIGSPEWAHTAAVYMRGWMHNECGVKLQDVHWFQAGANDAGRIEKVELSLPAGVQLTRVSDKSLSEMLASGEIAAAIGVEIDSPDVKPLIADPLEAGLAALKSRGHYPINHTVVIKDDLIAARPGLAADVFDAFARSKALYLEKLKAGQIEKMTETDKMHLRVMETLADPLPYHIEPNRKTLETLVGHAFAQGIITKKYAVEELFAKGTHGLVG